MAGVAVALLLALVPARAHEPPSGPLPAVAERLAREAVAHYHLPGLAIGVVEDGKVVFVQGYGERLAGSGEAVDSQTLFKIASNSKAMTAALLARLVDQGKLRWDDPLLRHLPDFRMHDPWVTQNFQVRDLLIHASGLGLGAGDLMLWPEPNDFSRTDVLAGLAHLRPASSFRSHYAYDNLLYIVAGELAARVGGDSYEHLLEREVFKPLGLSRCRVGGFSRDAVGNIAQPHRRGADGNVPGQVDVEVVPEQVSAAAGGVRCSLDDMLTWMRNWLDPELTPGWLSTEQRRAITSLQMPMPVSERDRRWENLHLRGYGYGLRISDPYGQYRVGHTGTLDGMYSAMAMFPERRSGYVFLINGEADEARAVLEAALSRIIAKPGSGVAIESFALDLEHHRTAPAAAPAALVREKVVPTDVAGILGQYEDAWFGPIRLCPAADEVQWISLKSPRLRGTLWRADGRLLVAWDDPGIHGADAWLDPGEGEGGAQVLALQAIDPELDFSFDFQDLAPRRQRACD